MARTPLALPTWASRSRLEILGAIVLVAAALRYWLWYFNRSTNLLDEGSQAAQALRVIHGDLIYRDFFTVVTPGSYYTVAWLFQLFGAELIVMRWAILVLGLAILLCTLIAARHLMAWPFAAAAALMTTVWGWFLVAPNFYSWQAALFSLLALVCYLRWAQGGKGAWLIWAGAMSGLTVLVKQNVGAYTTGALLLAIWLSLFFEANGGIRGRFRASWYFIGSMLAPVVAVVAWLIVAGAGPYLYESWVYYPLAVYPPRFSVPYPTFYPLLPDPQLSTLGQVIPVWLSGGIAEPVVYELYSKLVIYLPAIVYPLAFLALVGLAIRCRRGDEKAGRHGHALLAITLVGLLTLLQAFPRADVTHILFGLQPTFILFGYVSFVCWKAWSHLPGPRVLVAGAGLIVTLAPISAFLWNGYLRTQWEYQNYIVALKIDRGRGIFASGIEAQRINLMTRYVIDNTAPDDPVFVVPWASGFNFLTDRANPTRADFMLFEDPESYPCILSRLERNPPKYVIYGYVWDVDNRRFAEYARPLDEYIRSRYVLEDSVDGYEVWRRVEGANPGRMEWPQACQPRRFRLSDLLGPPTSGG